MWTAAELKRQRDAARAQAIAELQRRIDNVKWYVRASAADPQCSQRCRDLWRQQLEEREAELTQLQQEGL